MANSPKRQELVLLLQTITSEPSPAWKILTYGQGSGDGDGVQISNIKKILPNTRKLTFVNKANKEVMLTLMTIIIVVPIIRVAQPVAALQPGCEEMERE